MLERNAPQFFPHISHTLVAFYLGKKFLCFRYSISTGAKGDRATTAAMSFRTWNFFSLSLRQSNLQVFRVKYCIRSWKHILSRVQWPLPRRGTTLFRLFSSLKDDWKFCFDRNCPDKSSSYEFVASSLGNTQLETHPTLCLRSSVIWCHRRVGARFITLTS